MSSSSTQQLVLVTGGSGFVGISIALEFLRNGYPVRLAIRDDKLQAKFTGGKFADFQDLISFILVKDITAPGAYDEAVKDVAFIVHSASPVPGNVKDNKADLLEPAIQGALEMLRSAKKSPSVKRVVLTSSVVSHMNFLSPPAEGSVIGEKNWNSTTYEEAAGTPISPETDFYVYAASKALAERAAWNFMEAEKPQFTLVAVNPGWVTGASEDPSLKKFSDLRSSHGITAANMFVVKEFPTQPTAFIDVEDVAKAHFGAATVEAAAGRRFLLVAGPMTYAMAGAYVAKAVPELAERMPHTRGDADFEETVTYDGSPAEKVLGLKYTSLEDTMAAFARQISQLST